MDDFEKTGPTPEIGAGVGRRGFLGRLTAMAAGAAIGSQAGCHKDGDDEVAQAPDRKAQSYARRVSAAQAERDLPCPVQTPNSDETLYPTRIGSHAKALPHDALGRVQSTAYQELLNALQAGTHAAFEMVTLGGTQKLGNPQAAYAFALEGPDSQHLPCPAPPAFSSSWRAGEMAEAYWQALTRDVAFADYGTDLDAAAAAADLNSYAEFVAHNGMTTTANLFRGPTAGDLVGPYVSQFLYKPVPLGPVTLDQKIPVPLPLTDKLTTYATWLTNQNGAGNDTAVAMDPTPRYLRNNRDLAEWVHRDFDYLGGMYAALILNGFGGGALKPGHPYKGAAAVKQGGFVTFGLMHVLDKVARVADLALRACWFQKWLVHRTLRPEEYAGHLHNHIAGATVHPIHPELLAASKLAPGGLLARVAARNLAVGGSATYLISTSYPEGSPPFSAYPSGHATFAGACATALKYFFDESFVIPSPVQPDAAGTALVPYAGPSLTIGGELDKLAFNVGMGRCAAGIHWRSDIVEGNILGEAIALGVLRDSKASFNESYTATITKFDGTTVVI